MRKWKRWGVTMAVGLGLMSGGWALAQEKPAAPPAAKPAMPMAEKKMAKASEEVKKIQQALKKAGFDPGAIDGMMGKKTRGAVMAFQKANGLKDDGKVGKLTMAKLQPFMTP